MIARFNCPACEGEPTNIASKWREVCDVCHGRKTCYVAKTSGKFLKEQGIAKMNGRFPEYRDQVKNTIGLLAEIKSEFTADDVRARLPQPPHPNVIGASFNACAKANVIELAGGFERSKRPEAHGRLLPLWRKKQ